MLTKLFNTEPAVLISSTIGVLDGLLVLLFTFGVPVTPDQKVAIDGFATALLGLVALVTSGILIRSQVTPVTPPPANPPVA